MANEALRMDLFGPSPSEVMQARQQQQNNQAMQWANMPAGRGMVAAGAQAGQSFGNALGGMMGMQDPAVERAQRMQMAQMETEEFARANGIDLATKPQDYYKLATQTLSKYGLANEAAQVAEIARNTALQEREMKYKEDSLLAQGGDRYGFEKGYVIDKRTGDVKKVPGYVDSDAASPVGKIMADWQSGVYGKPDSPEAIKLRDAAITKATTVRQENITINNPFESTLDKELAKIGAGDLGGLSTSSAIGNYNAGVDASNRILELAQDPNVKIGAGAEVALAASKLFNITGANNGEIIAKTQVMAQNLAKITLSNIKNSGLGTGQGFTDKDLKFLERASAGDISFDKDSIIEFALANLRGQRRWMAHRNKILEQISPETRQKLRSAGLDADAYDLPVIPDIKTTVNTPKPTAKAATKDPAPEGIRQEVWDVMPEDKKALWR